MVGKVRPNNGIINLRNKLIQFSTLLLILKALLNWVCDRRQKSMNKKMF